MTDRTEDGNFVKKWDGGASKIILPAGGFGRLGVSGFLATNHYGTDELNGAEAQAVNVDREAFVFPL
jgi:hypothetical protein